MIKKSQRAKTILKFHLTIPYLKTKEDDSSQIHKIQIWIKSSWQRGMSGPRVFLTIYTFIFLILIG